MIHIAHTRFPSCYLLYIVNYQKIIFLLHATVTFNEGQSHWNWHLSIEGTVIFEPSLNLFCIVGMVIPAIKYGNAVLLRHVLVGSNLTINTLARSLSVAFFIRGSHL